MLNYVNSTAKVLYDKTIDYINNKTTPDDIIDDTICDYGGIKVELYEDENESKRIYPYIGLYNEYAAFWSEPTHIVDNIYLGSAFNAASYNILKKFNIKVIINATAEISNYYENSEEFIYLRYKLYDNNQNRISQYLEQSFNDIKFHQDKNILIHCFMGASRSASIVLYYLMKTKTHHDGESYTFDDAIAYLKTKRITVNPTFRLTKDIIGSIPKN